MARKILPACWFSIRLSGKCRKPLGQEPRIHGTRYVNSGRQVAIAQVNRRRTLTVRKVRSWPDPDGRGWRPSSAAHWVSADLPWSRHVLPVALARQLAGRWPRRTHGGLSVSNRPWRPHLPDGAPLARISPITSINPDAQRGPNQAPRRLHPLSRQGTSPPLRRMGPKTAHGDGWDPNRALSAEMGPKGGNPWLMGPNSLA